MRIELTTEGGIASFPGLRKPVAVDGERLSPEQAAELQGLIDAARFFELPEMADRPRRGADYREYTLTVEDRGRRHTVRFSDLTDNEALKRLAARVKSLAANPTR
jgi:hypothetical protein